MFFSRNNLPKIKYGACMKNIDECESIGTQGIPLYVAAEDIRSKYKLENSYKTKISYQIFIDYKYTIR